jgi:hypothetical protein
LFVAFIAHHVPFTDGARELWAGGERSGLGVVDASNAAAEDQLWLISGRQSGRCLGARETDEPRSAYFMA